MSAVSFCLTEFSDKDLTEPLVGDIAMRTTRLAVIACGALAAGAWASSPASQAAMGIAPAKTPNMSLIEPIVANKGLRKQMKKGVRYTCTDWGFMHCCTSAGHSFCADDPK